MSVREAPNAYMPVDADSNSPAYWRGGQLHLLNSTGVTLRTVGANQFFLWQGETGPVFIDGQHLPAWIESVHQEDEDTLWAWYHHEPGGLCPGNQLTAPKIGALVSRDGGLTFRDLGIVLEAGDPLDCNARNGYFAGGHGDFSVIVQDGYFYFLFGNYGGAARDQGVSLARMDWNDRAEPVGKVWKYHAGGWDEPGLGGKSAPVFPAAAPWGGANTDSFWGPSIHWNHYLERYVILMTRTCCAPEWPSEGIYAVFADDLSDPAAWSTPRRLLSAAQVGFGPVWYPQVLGTAYGETDTFAGRVARLYVKGVSHWEIEFAP